VNKADDHSDDNPLDEVSNSLPQSEFQPDVQVHAVVQHKSANRENVGRLVDLRVALLYPPTHESPQMDDNVCRMLRRAGLR